MTKQTRQGIYRLPSFFIVEINAWAMSASFIELIKGVVIRVVVYNATFNNISHFSYIVVVSFKLEETGENHRPVASH